MAYTTSKEIFDRLAGRFNPEAAGAWNAVIQFNVAGANGGNYHITVSGGTCKVDQGTAPNPTATVNTTDQVWIGIANNTVNPQMAFMMGQISVKGNIGDVMKLNNPTIFRKE